MRVPSAILAAGIAVGAGGIGCGSEPQHPPQLQAEEPGGHDAGGGDGGDGRSPAASPDASDGDATSVATTCAVGARVLYVVDTAGVLRSFDPSLLPSLSAFKAIGTMNCRLADGGAWGAASSMAIDHNAVAWVTDRNGALFKVSTSDASCQPTGFQIDQGFIKVGMGFAGDISRGTETLYVVDNSLASFTGGGKGLAWVDLDTLALKPIANFDAPLTGTLAELTGSGDGRLFGFFPAVSSLAQIDRVTGHTLSSAPVPLSTPRGGAGEFDYALSFWGGVFFLYTASTQSAEGPTTDVSAFDPSTGTTIPVLSQIGFNVVGAGSSTCVPLHGDLHVAVGDGGLAQGDASNDAGDTEAP